MVPLLKLIIIRGVEILSIDFHRLVRPIDINRLIFIDYYRLYRLISDDRLSSLRHAAVIRKALKRVARLFYS